MGSLWQTLRYTLRILAKNRGFSLLGNDLISSYSYGRPSVFCPYIVYWIPGILLQSTLRPL